jgi:hypothetical protein
MKKIVFCILVLFLTGCAGTSSISRGPSVKLTEKPQDYDQGFILDYKNPISIIEAIFYAARTGDVDVMTNLCDPAVQNDNATEDICFVELEDRVLKQFMKKFENGEIVGDVEYEYDFAYINVRGIDKSNKIYTFTLVNRYGNWFLFRFM